MLFGHGDDIYSTKQEVKINFSSNVWTGTNQTKFEQHLQDNLKCINHYPEPDAGSLRRLLARRNEVEKENVLVTNGSISAFYLLAQAYPKSKSTIVFPTFSEYEDACALYGHELSFYSNSEDLSSINLENQDFCWICNPNNPDGKLFSRLELITLLDANPNTLFVIDQAYVAFTTELLLMAEDIKRYPNLIIVQSISKNYNTPGLRIGYIVASDSIISKVRKFIIPWTINALAIEASKYILIHPAQFTLPIRKWQRDTEDLVYKLMKFEDLNVIHSSTTFFLVKLLRGNSKDLKNYLLDNYGILIRDASNFRGLDESYIRICAKSTNENTQLLEAIKQYFQTI